MSFHKKIILAITLGDPGGIGPEIALKAASQIRRPRNLRLVLLGSRSILQHQARRLGQPLPPPWQLADEHRPAAPVVHWDPRLDPDLPSGSFRPIPLPWAPGRTGKRQGQAAIQWIHAAVSGCLAGIFDGLVTGPVCKKSLRLAGLPFPGHTEYLAHLTLARRYAMMLIGGPLRVALATRHLPLSRVATSISIKNVMETARLSAQAVDWLGVRPQTVGVCALNPHAGDAGLLGREEITILGPAIRALRRQGLDVEGPVPADVIFYQALRNRYGAVVAMYHDQGLGPLKMIAFDTGVNLTLGLPIVRTAPDHGTAFNIAGRGIANPASLIAAIRLAARLARRKNPWHK